MTAFINPGAGKVWDTTFNDSHINMDVFLDDLDIPDVVCHTDPNPACGNGRYRYHLARIGHHGATVDMPGRPLEEVRVTDEFGVEITQFYRLYVDESSWWWPFALSMVRYSLTWPFGEEAEDGEICECRSCLAAREKGS